MSRFCCGVWVVNTNAEGNRTETPAGESDPRRYMVEGSCFSLLLDMKEASIQTGQREQQSPIAPSDRVHFRFHVGRPHRI